MYAYRVIIERAQIFRSLARNGINLHSLLSLKPNGNKFIPFVVTLKEYEIDRHSMFRMILAVNYEYFPKQ